MGRMRLEKKHGIGDEGVAFEQLRELGELEVQHVLIMWIELYQLFAA
jgi:hypothetical protein